jgi:uncharacterized iron-regulated membrane protein
LGLTTPRLKLGIRSRMKGIHLNKLHRYVGIIIAPFMAIQTLTGLLLSFGPFRRGGSAVTGWNLSIIDKGWDDIFIKTHFGPGLISDGYHLLLGAGIIWMALSGWMLYLRGMRLRKKTGNNNAAGVKP